MSVKEIEYLYARSSRSEEFEESIWSEKISYNEDNFEENLMDESDYEVISKNFAPIHDKNLISSSNSTSRKPCVSQENRKKMKFIITRDYTPHTNSFVNSNKNVNPCPTSPIPRNDLRTKQRICFPNNAKNIKNNVKHSSRVRRKSKF